MRSKVVTVFGGSGFVGRYVVQRLAHQGDVVRVPTRRPERAVHLQPLGNVGQIVLERWRPGAPGELDRVLDGAEVAINLIGILFEPKAGDFERLQARLPGAIGAAATRAGLARFIQLSAIGADPGSPSLYARTKAAGEAAAREAYPQVTLIRPSIIFGPEDGFFNRFARMSQLAPALPLIGGGRTRFQPVYVGDVADAVAAVVARPETVGRLFELGGPTVYSFKDLMSYLLRVTGRRRLLVPLPFDLARLQARFLQYLPEPPLTPDQVELLKRDNVVAADAEGFVALGLKPAPLETIVPQYLRAYGRPSVRLPVI